MRYEQLWAPWRLSYVQPDAAQTEARETPVPLLPGADAKCFLCRGAVDPDARSCFVVHRSESSFTVLNRYPYNNGHLLVAPQSHRAGLEDLTAGEQADLLQEVVSMKALLAKVLRPEGFNVGLNLGSAAGAGLPDHLHWHIVPRWHGDTNFMPAVAAVKVIPQALDALWEALAQALASGGMLPPLNLKP